MANPKTSGASPAVAPSQNAIEVTANAIEVTAKVEGFRRVGRAFTRAPQRLALADLAEGQLEALQAEPMLTVVLITVPTEPVESGPEVG